MGILGWGCGTERIEGAERNLQKCALRSEVIFPLHSAHMLWSQIIWFKSGLQSWIANNLIQIGMLECTSRIIWLRSGLWERRSQTEHVSEVVWFSAQYAALCACAPRSRSQPKQKCSANIPLTLKSNQIKSNHFYCHITTAQVPWWVKFLWACSRQCKKKITYGQYIFTDCTEDNVQNTHTYSVHIVYYKDILNDQLHIIHRMCTSTLCTLSIHYVVYT